MICVTTCPLLRNRPSILPQHLCFLKSAFVRLGFYSDNLCLFRRSRPSCRTIQPTPSTTPAWRSFPPSPASESHARADLPAARRPCPTTSYQTSSVSASLVSCCQGDLSGFYFFSWCSSPAPLFQRRRWTARCLPGHPGVCAWVPAPGAASVTARATSSCGQPTRAPPAPSWRSRPSACPTAAWSGSNPPAELLHCSTLGLPRLYY